MIQYVPKRLQYTDLYVQQYGIEPCAPGHHYGPAVRDHYLIHYILAGRGTYRVGSNTYALQAGEGFLITPDIVTYYEADRCQPWHYCWVGFHGHQAGSILAEAGLSAEQPIFRYDRDEQLRKQFMRMTETGQLDYADELQLLGTLYNLLSLLVQANPEKPARRRVGKKEAYAKKVLDFIEANYSEKITVAQAARFVGLDRSYLCSLFRECFHSSIQEYLIQFRMKKAAELLANPELTIGDVARSVGYQDPLLFSKTFKKHTGQSPKHYREQGEG
ncbi:AraC family transcriptional regulator [Xylanibacillus composti]|uniref:AraC family transcriptional regulator n=1 Tax=Xylanibacillus composti TaxID=1572762 RepID=A0A8J4M2R6_9BACL|nr:AraC family transcriptional regulator [Xylanibacillus composti]MDT9726044.1 AraC family transcriptional regulator [Xylanibacillus composti]GIQ68811.1 AraC family transcriptional regulator [Xylanibacillus composti]